MCSSLMRRAEGRAGDAQLLTTGSGLLMPCPPQAWQETALLFLIFLLLLPRHLTLTQDTLISSASRACNVSGAEELDRGWSPADMPWGRNEPLPCLAICQDGVQGRKEQLSLEYWGKRCAKWGRGKQCITMSSALFLSFSMDIWSLPDELKHRTDNFICK